MATVCYHVSSMLIMERESGLSQLMDAMGGPETAWSRIASYMVTFDLLYLPLWIILGCSKSPFLSSSLFSSPVTGLLT